MLLEVSIVSKYESFEVRVWDPENEERIHELEGTFPSEELAIKHIESLKSNKENVIYPI